MGKEQGFRIVLHRMAAVRALDDAELIRGNEAGIELIDLKGFATSDTLALHVFHCLFTPENNEPEIRKLFYERFSDSQPFETCTKENQTLLFLALIELAFLPRPVQEILFSDRS